MVRQRVSLTHRRQRSVLTDMLPFEVPPTFSNRGFYRFVRAHNVELDGKRVRWEASDDHVDVAMALIFGFKQGFLLSTENAEQWGRKFMRRSVGPIGFNTIPFNFRVAHRLDGRVLTVVHPRNQVQVANFYASQSELITYYSSLSEFSIRRPVSVARFAYYKDKLHEQRLESVSNSVEEEDREYEQLGSYFVYRKYRNIHRFFESYKYHRCEKKYDSMVQIDISKCFDSIYTHSLSWALIGKSQTKASMDAAKRTFAGQFDQIMQNLNHGETNGIVIGPEFSRIFAELILQSVDVELADRLHSEVNLVHRVHYEIFRYVDDYFVFYDEPSAKLKIIETLQDVLRQKKLSINTAKMRSYEKPIITEITIAKERISTLFNDDIDPVHELTVVGDTTVKHLLCPINSNRLIIRYKTIIKEANVEYGDPLNYTLAILEQKIDRLLKLFLQTQRSDRDSRRLLTALLAIMEFCFFAYSASPKVNHTIRLCRMMSTAIEFLNDHAVQYELKHLLFKYLHDNILQQLNKNRMSHHREVEGLYLLVALSQIGREYWLPEAVLLNHFSINKNNDVYTRGNFAFLTHFSITVLLTYIRNKSRYAGLHTFVETHIVEKLAYVKAHCHNDAEGLILFLDIVTCPWVTPAAKQAAADVFGLGPVALAELEACNDQWFTAWGSRFRLGRELDAKRSREVY